MSKTTQNTIAALEAEHQKLHAEHEAKLAELSAKKEAITALRAPVTEWLALPPSDSVGQVPPAHQGCSARNRRARVVPRLSASEPQVAPAAGWRAARW